LIFVPYEHIISGMLLIFHNSYNNSLKIYLIIVLFYVTPVTTYPAQFTEYKPLTPKSEFGG